MSIAATTPLPSLSRFGLSADADLLFRTLTLLGPRPAEGLSHELGMARGRVDRALADLWDVGAVRPSGMAPLPAGRWHATPVDRLLVRMQARRRRPNTTRRVLPGGVTGAVELGVGVRHLATREATRQRLAGLVSIARHEHLSMNPEATFEHAALHAAAPMDRTLLARGVRVRVLGVQVPDADLLRPFGADSVQAAPSYREAPVVPMKLIVIDRRVAFFPVDPNNYERGYLEICQAPVVHSLICTFEQQWAAAQDFMEAVMPRFALAPREQAVVELLVLGYTDARTAAELRISERSVSTIVRSIMDRLGVENRFQLGVALGALRVAPPPPGLIDLSKPKRIGESRDPSMD